MKYLWLLQVVFSLNGEEITQSFPMPNEATCDRALRAGEPLHLVLDRELDELMIRCKKTSLVIGWTVRPKARPEWMENQK